MFLPKWLVIELLKQYEKKDIYLNRDKNFYRKKDELLSKSLIQVNDFYKFIEDTKNSEYTKFIVKSFDVLSIIDSIYKNDFLYDVKFKKILYIKFSSFKDDIIRKVETVMEEKSEYNKLIIDLRDNGGGNLECCLRLLNKFLPPMEYLEIDNLDRKVIFRSDKKFYRFKKIFIFLNEKTASCSEIFSLVLKKKLDNVFLIGKNTVCKECTQHTIVNNRYKFIFAIADGIWKVDNETVLDLQNYINNNVLTRLDYANQEDYLKCVLEIDKNEKYEVGHN